MGVLKKIVSWIFVFFCFLNLLFFTVTFVIKINFNEGKITNYLKETDFTFLLKTRDGKKTEIEENMEKVLEKMGIPKSTVLNVMNSEATKNFIGRYTYFVFKFLMFGGEAPTISSLDVSLLIEKNYEVIEKTLEENGKSFTQKQKDAIHLFVEKYQGQIMDLFPTVHLLLQKFENREIVLYGNISLYDMTSLFRFFFSDFCFFLFIGLAILFLFLLYLCHYKDKSFFSSFRMVLYFYTFFLIFLEILLGTIVKDVVMSSWEGADVFLNYLVNILSKNLAIFIVLGILFLVLLSRVIKKCKTNVKNVVSSTSSC